MTYVVQTIHETKHVVLNDKGDKVAESPTREAAEASAKVLNEAEQNKQ